MFVKRSCGYFEDGVWKLDDEQRKSASAETQRIPRACSACQSRNPRLLLQILRLTVKPAAAAPLPGMSN